MEGLYEIWSLDELFYYREDFNKTRNIIIHLERINSYCYLLEEQDIQFLKQAIKEGSLDKIKTLEKLLSQRFLNNLVRKRNVSAKSECNQHPPQSDKSPRIPDAKSGQVERPVQVSPDVNQKQRIVHSRKRTGK